MSENDHDDRDKRDKDKRGKETRDQEKLEFSTTTRGDEVANYLFQIADGLRLGTLTLRTGGHTVHLQPGEMLRLEVAAKNKADKGKGSLQLELSWKIPSPVHESDADELVIETEHQIPQVAAP